MSKTGAQCDALTRQRRANAPRFDEVRQLRQCQKDTQGTRFHGQNVPLETEEPTSMGGC